jgi:integrase
VVHRTNAARADRRPSLRLQVDQVVGAISAASVLSAQSLPRFTSLVDRFGEFCSSAYELTSLGTATPHVAEAFVRAATTTGPAAPATQHLRRASLRLLFRHARELGLCTHDPTLDLRLPARSKLPARPLTDDEIAVCRSFAICSLTNTRRPAAWALGEATARTAEIPGLTIGDLDLAGQRVRIHGSPRTEPRWGALSAWGAKQLARRVEMLHERGATSRTPLIYEGAGTAESRQASSCLAISDTLTAAGLAAERDVRPSSVAGWAGAVVLSETGRIEKAAAALGVRSLDRAARLIGWDWNTPDSRDAD